eukprot:COSAG01_NODE_5074_length_4506_cov_3.388700_1_plen_124_part_00
MSAPLPGSAPPAPPKGADINSTAPVGVVKRPRDAASEAPAPPPQQQQTKRSKKAVSILDVMGCTHGSASSYPRGEWGGNPPVKLRQIIREVAAAHRPSGSLDEAAEKVRVSLDRPLPLSTQCY